MVSLAYDVFEKLLAAQREVIDELVATQRQLAREFFDPTLTVGNKPTPRWATDFSGRPTTQLTPVQAQHGGVHSGEIQTSAYALKA